MSQLIQKLNYISQLAHNSTNDYPMNIPHDHMITWSSADADLPYHLVNVYITENHHAIFMANFRLGHGFNGYGSHFPMVFLWSSYCQSTHLDSPTHRHRGLRISVWPAWWLCPIVGMPRQTDGFDGFETRRLASDQWEYVWNIYGMVYGNIYGIWWFTSHIYGHLLMALVVIHGDLHNHLEMRINGHAGQEPIDWRYLNHI